MNKTLLFVYNAQSDLWSKSLDIAHKIISPATYNCDLCALTHGNFSERKVWATFKNSTDFQFIFMYRDEFLKQYGEGLGFEFPIILDSGYKEQLEVVLDAIRLKQLNSVEELIEVLEGYMAISNS